MEERSHVEVSCMVPSFLYGICIELVWCLKNWAKIWKDSACCGGWTGLHSLLNFLPLPLLKLWSWFIRSRRLIYTTAETTAVMDAGTTVALSGFIKLLELGHIVYGKYMSQWLGRCCHFSCSECNQSNCLNQALKLHSLITHWCLWQACFDWIQTCWICVL